MTPTPLVPILISAALGLPAGFAAARVVRTCAGGEAGLHPAQVAALAAALFAWAGATTPPGWILAASLCLGWALLCLGLIDLAVWRLPDVLTWPLVAAGLVVSTALPGAPILDHAAGAALGYGALAALAFAYRRLRGRDGVGMGDAKLLAAAGAWLGWTALPSVLLIACALAAAMVLLRRRPASPPPSAPVEGAMPIAFGAPLALAIWVVWLHGPLTP